MTTHSMDLLSDDSLFLKETGSLSPYSFLDVTPPADADSKGIFENKSFNEAVDELDFFALNACQIPPKTQNTENIPSELEKVCKDYLDDVPSISISEYLVPLEKSVPYKQPWTARMTPEEPFSREQAYGRFLQRNHRQSVSKISLSELYALMGLPHNHDLAREREAEIMSIVGELGFRVGRQTWIRDTSEVKRHWIISELYKHTFKRFGYTMQALEIIVRRGTYSRMQSRLRKSRRQKSAALRR